MKRPTNPANMTPAGRCKSCGWSAADCDCGDAVNTEPDSPFEADGADGTALLELDFEEDEQ